MTDQEKLTDSQLNDLLAMKVIGVVSSIAQRLFGDGKLRSWTVNSFRDGSSIPDDWNPCQNYNHLRQVEEALSEEQKDKYAEIMEDWSYYRENSSQFYEILYATARQRCEAIARVVGGK